MSNKLVYIYTIGCQMNVYDSEQFEKLLAPLGYSRTEFLEQADLVITNTCSVREKAEEKAFSFIGRLQALKKKKKSLISGVAGCVAQQEGKNILDRLPYVDFVIGTHAVARLHDIVRSIEISGGRIVDTSFNEDIEEYNVLPEYRSHSVSGFITIMRGCDNFCSYCVVPHVRGRESSRKPDAIISEIRSAVKGGRKEITLLGQNVNSYGKKEGLPSFPELLRMIHDIEGLERIRFATSHPKDMSDELVKAYKDLDKLCKHIHLPVQCGSDRILKSMNRKYTSADYFEKIEKLRNACPDIAITSDMIVGFPGEELEDFEATLDLVRKVEFDNIFAFAYSDRPFAPAAMFEGKMPEKERKRRLNELLDVQDEISKKKNVAMEGRTEVVLVEGMSRRSNSDSDVADSEPVQWTGRTDGNKVLNFTVEQDGSGSDVSIDLTGKIIPVVVADGLGHSLRGVAKLKNLDL
ncbi:tRNA (N6-isopentenyl adenosine(37)-C2)-methylthiotransferase MiaB [Desulforegula conservatrix]|uniref:tRNA (N6-isopentenyl adenosine(37)-C2)-methylthiotransferase MiaB n=1 Tax=Desulforegula conservatrix TaxID=153026 RepID=UPI00040F2F65|nr:tRNA (N6-isopentenyl adenosine(37)-C2)-methylthiotransferase MiaB [Desulforegula conservatrix]